MRYLFLILLTSCKLFTDSGSLPGCTSNCDIDIAPVFSTVSTSSTVATVGTAITDIVVTYTGTTLSSCTAETSGGVSLPAGLSVSSSVSGDSVLCTISGTATGSVLSSTSYVVTAINSKGSATASTAIEVKTLPTLSTQSVSTLTTDKSIAITSITLTFTGSDVSSGSCSVSPTLVSGLSIAASTSGSDLICTISGTPTVVSTSTSYTVTATSANGSGTGTVSIEVVVARCTESFDTGATPAGAGTSSNPYIICTGAQLKTIIDAAGSVDTNIHLYLQADLDIDGLTFPLANNNSDTEFLGTLTGNGFKITSPINKITEAIFNTISSGTIIQSIEIEDVNVSNNSTGVISDFGTAGATIQGLYFSGGTLAGNSSGAILVGGTTTVVIKENIIDIGITNSNSFCIAGGTPNTATNNYYNTTKDTGGCDVQSLVASELTGVTTTQLTDSDNVPNLSSTFWTLVSGSAPALIKTIYKSSSAAELGSP
jgi:hypothetical protein